MPRKPIPPPPAIDCSRVLVYAILDRTIPFSGRTLLFRNGKEVGRVPRLAICEDPMGDGVLLFHCKTNWSTVGCAAMSSIREAKSRAERIYPGISERWINPKVSRKKGELYLDEVFGEFRCGKCKKRADKVESLYGKKENTSLKTAFHSL